MSKTLFIASLLFAFGALVSSAENATTPANLPPIVPPANDSIGARNFVCTMYTDLPGDDIYNSQMTYDDCVKQCRKNLYCTALTWVPVIESNPLGTCYSKHLADPNRAPVPTQKYMISCKETIASPPADFVLFEDTMVWGDDLQVLDKVDTKHQCLLACRGNSACVAFYYVKNSKICVLKRSATTYQPIPNNRPGSGYVSGFRHTYQFCQAPGDLFGKYDSFDFKGTFSACASCVVDLNRANAFTWSAGVVDSNGVPIEGIGHCYCKKVPLPFDPNTVDQKGGVFCV